MQLIVYRMLDHLQKLTRREEGQTLVEYALIIAVIAIMIIGALVFLRGSVSGAFSNVGSSIVNGG